jgi:hypothetical protein
MSKFNPKDHLIDLRGKQYLPVAARLLWFREAQPLGKIDSEVVETSPLIIKATIYNGDGKPIASGLGSANADGKRVVWSGREVEKAETAAIGRALAHAGYGTQFTADDDADYLADTPQNFTQAPQGNATPKQAQSSTQAQSKPEKRWQRDEKRVQAFFKFAQDERGLDRESALRVLGVELIDLYEGTDKDAAAAIRAYNPLIDGIDGEKKPNQYDKELEF